MGEAYEIKLKQNANPHAIYTPRQVPIPYRSKVKEELKRMEELGVISRVEEPTTWCSGMVAIPKKNGSVRICVDLRPLNRSVLREVYPLPKVDDLLAQLNGAKIFQQTGCQFRLLADTTDRRIETAHHLPNTNGQVLL